MTTPLYTCRMAAQKEKPAVVAVPVAENEEESVSMDDCEFYCWGAI